MNFGYVLAFGLADNRLDAFLFRERDGGEAVGFELVRVSVAAADKFLALFPWQADSHQRLNPRKIWA